MIIDTHCHYNLEPLANSWKTHWQKSQAQGVTHSIVVGTKVETSQLAVEISHQEQNLSATVAVHPGHVAEDDGNQNFEEIETKIDDDLLELEKILESEKGIGEVVAIGETGLDYFRLPKDETQAGLVREAQKIAFKSHLALAAENNLPAILHVRDQLTPETPTPGNAYWDTLAAVQEIRKSGYDLPVIMHCISGPVSYHSEMLKLGAYVGVAGNATYPSAKAIRELVSNTPADRLLLETDAPFLPPQQFRGQKCEPWMIKHTHDYLVKEMGVESQQVIENSLEVFGLG